MRGRRFYMDGHVYGYLRRHGQLRRTTRQSAGQLLQVNNKCLLGKMCGRIVHLDTLNFAPELCSVSQSIKLSVFLGKGGLFTDDIL